MMGVFRFGSRGAQGLTGNFTEESSVPLSTAANEEGEMETVAELEDATVYDFRV